MKTIGIGGGLALCTLLGLGASLGCSSGEEQGSNSSSSSASGSGGADAGRICSWSGTGGGVSIPECDHNSTTLQGTIDGQPYTLSLPGNMYTNAPPVTDPPAYVVDVPLIDGFLHADWVDSKAWGQFVPITDGYMRLPTETKMRWIEIGVSKIRLQCPNIDSSIQFILYVDGGQLTACARD